MSCFPTIYREKSIYVHYSKSLGAASAARAIFISRGTHERSETPTVPDQAQLRSREDWAAREVGAKARDRERGGAMTVLPLLLIALGLMGAGAALFWLGWWMLGVLV